MSSRNKKELSVGDAAEAGLMVVTLIVIAILAILILAVIIGVLVAMIQYIWGPILSPEAVIPWL